jgi:GTP-binding protein
MLDKVTLRVKAGDGGRGAVTFRHEKFVPFGGPFGGDGGRGGSVIVRADEGVSTLRAYQRRRDFKAQNGQNGMTKNKHGADGANLVLAAPPGTLVYLRAPSGEDTLLADLEKAGEEVVVAQGGRGGWGNSHFATPTNQAPRVAQPGRAGDECAIVLELRLIADVGVIGYPNVGKSSLLAAISAARPKIAAYPFTTLEPVLGVVENENQNFVVAEIPGLIKDAHLGKGLGLDFLRHAMRTKLFVHLIDGESEHPVEDMIQVNNELSLFDATLATRPQVVAINKIDLPGVEKRREALQAAFQEAGVAPLFISASAGIGLNELVGETARLLRAANLRDKLALPQPTKVFRPRAIDRNPAVQKKGNSFILVDPTLEKLLNKLDIDDPQGLEEFNQNLEKLGINKLLRSAGAKSGATVVTGNLEWEWRDDEPRRNRRNVRSGP